MNQNPQPQSITQYPGLAPMKDFLDKEEIALLKRTMLARFSEEEQETFIKMVLRTRLDPWSRQIYATRRMQKGADGQKVAVLVPVTGILGLTAVADRTGHYKGCVLRWSSGDAVWHEEWLKDEYPSAAKCIVYHAQRMEYPEVGIARWMSFVGQTYNYQTKTWEVSDFWSRMPDYMLGKCAKALALRGAFPDQLSNIYIREELESRITDADLDTTAISEDEEKIAQNQRLDDEAKKSGVKFVQGTGIRPTPEAAAEPAFEEDAPKVAPIPPPQKKVVAQPPDELDLSPKDETPEGRPTSVPRWKNHLIQTVKHSKFSKRRLGDLSTLELEVLENQWIPKMRAQWDDCTEEQKEEIEMFEAAIAFHKMEKPW